MTTINFRIRERLTLIIINVNLCVAFGIDFREMRAHTAHSTAHTHIEIGKKWLAIFK